MDWSSVGDRTKKESLRIVENVGESALHAIAPDNFEYYQMSLELIDCDDNQVGFISFGVMPNNLSESRQPIQTQTKTRSGMITTFNDSFSPINISMQGTFGRKFRLVTGIVDPTPREWKDNFFNGNLGKIRESAISYKSGYGLTKVLKYVLEKSNELDSQGRPYILIYNNYAFNTSYIVDVISHSFNQSVENNRLWYYEVSLKAVAPSSAIQSTKDRNAKLLRSVASNSVAQGLSNIVKEVKRNNRLTFI